MLESKYENESLARHWQKLFSAKKLFISSLFITTSGTFVPELMWLNKEKCELDKKIFEIQLDSKIVVLSFLYWSILDNKKIEIGGA